MRKSVVLPKQTRRKSCEKEWARLKTPVKTVNVIELQYETHIIQDYSSTNPGTVTYC